MTPRRLVAILLEAGDLLPGAEFDDEGLDPKAFTSRASDDIPLPGQGVNIRGTHANWSEKFRQKRLHKFPDEEYFRVDRNTWLVRYPSGNIAVRFHQTDIITVTPDDTMVVDNGGFYTVTTMARMNDWFPSGWGIYKQNNEWWWNNYRWDDDFLNPGYRRLQPYSNGDRVTSDGMLYAKAPFMLKKTRPRREAI